MGVLEAENPAKHRSRTLPTAGYHPSLPAPADSSRRSRPGPGDRFGGEADDEASLASRIVTAHRDGGVFCLLWEVRDIVWPLRQKAESRGLRFRFMDGGK